MDLLQFIRLLFRHWFVVGLTLVATAVAAVMFSSRVEEMYEAHGSLLLLTPSSVDSPTGRVQVNPFTRLGTTERIASTLLVNVSLSQSFVSRMERQGVEDYRVTVDPSGGGAIVNLEVVDGAGEDSVRGLELLRQVLSEELANRQGSAGAPRDTWITLEILTFPTRAALLTGSRMRVLAAVALLGAGLAASLAVLAESVRPKRKRRRRDPAQAGQEFAEGRRPRRRRRATSDAADDGQTLTEVARSGSEHDQTEVQEDGPAGSDHDPTEVQEAQPDRAEGRRSRTKRRSRPDIEPPDRHFVDVPQATASASTLNSRRGTVADRPVSRHVPPDPST